MDVVKMGRRVMPSTEIMQIHSMTNTIIESDSKQVQVNQKLLCEWFWILAGYCNDSYVDHELVAIGSTLFDLDKRTTGIGVILTKGTLHSYKIL